MKKTLFIFIPPIGTGATNKIMSVPPRTVLTFSYSVGMKILIQYCNITAPRGGDTAPDLSSTEGLSMIPERSYLFEFACPQLNAPVARGK